MRRAASKVPPKATAIRTAKVLASFEAQEKRLAARIEAIWAEIEAEEIERREALAAIAREAY